MYTPLRSLEEIGRVGVKCKNKQILTIPLACLDGQERVV